MENNNKKNSFKYTDSFNSNREVEVCDDDFKFVQKDKSIHDLKFKDKPTTFLKDSLKRFVKNKSSVAGGIILGIIIMSALLVPMLMPSYGAYNVADGSSTSETEMPPKLFDNANGFWDGTIQKTDYQFDKTTGLPAGYAKSVVKNLVTYDKIENKATQYGEGGKLVISAPMYSKSEADYVGLFSNNTFDLDLAANDYNISLTTAYEKYGDYNVFSDVRLVLVGQPITQKNELTGLDETINQPSYLLTGSEEGNGYFVTNKAEYGDTTTLTVNVNSALKSINTGFGKTSLSSYKLLLGIKPSATENRFLFINDFSFTTSGTDKDSIEIMSFKDGNQAILNSLNGSNLSGWTDNLASRNAFGVTNNYCSFLFDKYYDVYGDKLLDKNGIYVTLAIKNDYIKFDMTGISGTDCSNLTEEQIAARLTILDDVNSNIRAIKKITGTPTINSAGIISGGATFTCVVSQYRDLGYTHMPKFVFGTNNKGQDFFAKINKGLRLSLVIAFSVAIINICIGLIWGSISGYFGGWTDIVMERITDIIGGLPTMVIITLCILYAHNDILAMLIALFMTGWMGVAGRTRTQFYRFKRSEYVLASRTLGARDSRLIFRHILPNSMCTIITSSILMIPSVMYTESSIAYLGLGLQDVTMFGVILSEGKAFFKGDSSYLLVIPTVIMMFLMIAFNLFGNGLRDAFNPSLKGSE